MNNIENEFEFKSFMEKFGPKDSDSRKSYLSRLNFISKTGFKIDNQEVITTFGTPKVETETSPTPAITPIVENVTPQNSERNSSIITDEVGNQIVELNKTAKNSAKSIK